MPSDANIESFLFDTLQQYTEYFGAESANHPHPSLANDVLPMFYQRWVTGSDQCTPEIADRMTPVFRLASRFLMEHYPLKWFAHLIFGDRVRGSSGTYIRETSFSKSNDAISKVRETIHNVGKLVTFMFDPPDYPGMSANGLTVRSRSDAERKYGRTRHQMYWPRDSRSAQQGHALPVIVLNREWLAFFRRRPSPSENELYRVMFLLAVTLVHEFTHACNAWLTPVDKEPLWVETDKLAELGWSWERHVIGYGLAPFIDSFSPDMQIRYLYQIKMDDYHTAKQREELLRKFGGSNRTDQPTCADAHGKLEKPPRLAATDNPNNYVAAAQVVPMKWVVSWFSEGKWQERAIHWRCENRYVRPSLGNNFVLFYECRGHKSSIYRPLNPKFAIDREILECRARGDHRR
ncbi:hypothetical protein DE146DRAFT_664214 [Phaeosphaeria sp. MPI-PUGE-AT-0046c]|nr:hypothetical protein DE146DRAFT_664214 [Phaeosphaeria sp. MPI-PUGE-AT-0046c]